LGVVGETLQDEQCGMSWEADMPTPVWIVQYILVKWSSLWKSTWSI